MKFQQLTIKEESNWYSYLAAATQNTVFTRWRGQEGKDIPQIGRAHTGIHLEKNGYLIAKKTKPSNVFKLLPTQTPKECQVGPMTSAQTYYFFIEIWWVFFFSSSSKCSVIPTMHYLLMLTLLDLQTLIFKFVEN